MAKAMTVSEMASLGGKARAASLTPEQRSAIARKAGSSKGKKRSNAKREKVSR